MGNDKSYEDIKQDYQQFKSMEKFMTCFVDRFVVCDPLDRSFEGELTYKDDDENEIDVHVSVDELKRRL